MRSKLNLQLFIRSFFSFKKLRVGSNPGKMKLSKFRTFVQDIYSGHFPPKQNMNNCLILKLDQYEMCKMYISFRCRWSWSNFNNKYWNTSSNNKCRCSSFLTKLFIFYQVYLIVCSEYSLLNITQESKIILEFYSNTNE